MAWHGSVQIEISLTRRKRQCKQIVATSYRVAAGFTSNSEAAGWRENLKSFCELFRKSTLRTLIFFGGPFVLLAGAPITV